MVALWLTIVAPVISQTVANPLDSLISMGACGVHHADGSQTPPAGHPLEKCGYCGLLAGHSLLPETASLTAPPTFAKAPVLPLPAPAMRGADRCLAAAPRGPPAFPRT